MLPDRRALGPGALGATLPGSGESNAELSRRLFVSEATPKTYVSRLLTKLDLTNRTRAAMLADEAGLLHG